MAKPAIVGLERAVRWGDAPGQCVSVQGRAGRGLHDGCHAQKAQRRKSATALKGRYERSRILFTKGKTKTQKTTPMINIDSYTIYLAFPRRPEQYLLAATDPPVRALSQLIYRMQAKVLVG